MTSPTPPHETDLPSARQLKLIITGVLLGVLLSALDQTIVSTALPKVVADIGGISGLPWVVTVYLLTAMASTPVWGKLADLFGARGMFAAAITIFLVGSVLSGLAQDIYQLIAFRGLQGLGGGGLFALALSIIGAVVPPADRGKYQGVTGGVFALASLAGPVLGGALADALSWRWIFFVNLPVGLISLFVVLSGLKIATPRRQHAIDYPGVLLIVGGVTSLLLYLNWAGNEYGWAAPGPLGLLVLFLVAAVLLAVVEARAAEPIISLELFSDRLVRTANIFAFLAGFTMFSGVIYLPVYFQTVGGMSTSRAGLAMLPLMLGIVISSMTSGIMISKRGKYKIFPVSGAILVLLAAVGLATIGEDTPYLLVSLFGLIFGLGVGLTMQTVITAVQNSVPIQSIGSATGTVNFFQRLGSVVGTALLGSILSSRLATELAERFPAGTPLPDTDDVDAIRRLAEAVRAPVIDGYADALGAVFLVTAPFAAIAVLAAFLLVEMPGSPKGQTPEENTRQPADNTVKDEPALQRRSKLG